MAVKYKKGSDQKNSAAGFHSGPNNLSTARTYLPGKASWKYLLILMSMLAIPFYYGFSNHKSPKAASLVSIYQRHRLPGEINLTQNNSPEITGIKSIDAFEHHFPGLLTALFNDVPNQPTTAANRLNLPGKVKLKRVEMLIVNIDTDGMAQTDSLPVGLLPIDPDDPAPLLRVTTTEGSLRARAQIKAYLDSLIVDPKPTGLITTAQGLINSAVTLSIK